MIKEADDKNLVIVAVFLLCLAMILINFAGSHDLIGNAISGLFGVAVGKGLNGNGGG